MSKHNVMFIFEISNLNVKVTGFEILFIIFKREQENVLVVDSD